MGETEKVLIVGNRRPLLKDLELEKIGVLIKDGFIVVNEKMRTNVQNVYAVGDVTGKKMFAHTAMAGGIIAAENIAGLEPTLDYRLIPSCIFCSPEMASVGLSEDEAKNQGYDTVIGKFPLIANGRALTLGEKEGFAKIICDTITGEILGAHLIAPNATDLISIITFAMQLECTNEELGALIQAHPTIGEILVEASKSISKKTIHL
jgi:dihydrolipoamide dehydrogenase